ncbi:pectate lyase superfamily protein-domain-containing protein [Mycena olivaceomarginata]|nr:pectate lyase superfamily protein-domain-containing protein [Mycena olivaceomarginata]
MPCSTDKCVRLASLNKNASSPGYKIFRNVKTDYHAVGDGVADDTVAINKAISDGIRCGQGCNSSTITTAVVYFPPGKYRVTHQLSCAWRITFNTSIIVFVRTGVHWQAGQATSLMNIDFKMSSEAGTKHQGVYAENGSGGFMSDLISNVKITNAVSAIYQLWNWGFT